MHVRRIVTFTDGTTDEILDMNYLIAEGVFRFLSADESYEIVFPIVNVKRIDSTTED